MDTLMYDKLISIDSKRNSRRQFSFINVNTHNVLKLFQTFPCHETNNVQIKK